MSKKIIIIVALDKNNNYAYEDGFGRAIIPWNSKETLDGLKV